MLVGDGRKQEVTCFKWREAGVPLTQLKIVWGPFRAWFGDFAYNPVSGLMFTRKPHVYGGKTVTIVNTRSGESREVPREGYLKPLCVTPMNGNLITNDADEWGDDPW